MTRALLLTDSEHPGSKWYSALLWHPLEHCVEFGEPQYKKGIKLQESFQRGEVGEGFRRETIRGVAKGTWFVQPGGDEG